jgi:hypothetical protein
MQGKGMHVLAGGCIALVTGVEPGQPTFGFLPPLILEQQ